MEAEWLISAGYPELTKPFEQVSYSCVLCRSNNVTFIDFIAITVQEMCVYLDFIYFFPGYRTSLNRSGASVVNIIKASCRGD